MPASRWQCPYCDGYFAAARRTVKCPHCGRTVQVPQMQGLAAKRAFWTSELKMVIAEFGVLSPALQALAEMLGLDGLE